MFCLLDWCVSSISGITCLSSYAHFNLTLSLDGSIVVHYNLYLLVLYLLVIVVTF